MLELSCADYTFPLLGRQQALRLIRMLELDYVDLGLFARNPNYLPSELMTSPGRFTQGVQESLAAAGLRAADVFLQIGNDPAESSANDPQASVREAGRETFLRAVEFCAAIACRHMTGLPGVAHGDPSQDFALAVEEAAHRVETAATAGVIYSIEPHLGSICASTQATLELLAQVPGLTLTLDYGHFIVQGESNAAIHRLLPHASHVHLRGAAPGRLQTPVAESSIDLQHIMQSLAGGYAGKLALEYVWSAWHECNRTDNVSETILLRRQVNDLKAKLNLGAGANV